MWALTLPAPDVRASKNVAYIAQKVADMDSILLPVWSSGIIEPEIVTAITFGYAVIFNARKMMMTSVYLCDCCMHRMQE